MMKLNIGETIKRLRKEREITQEEFAEILGVSCQSVSRWENNSCYPDIELIPTIAAFFGISTDRLMGVDEVAEKKAVDRYLQDFQAAISVGSIEDCIRIARAGVAEFPNNYALLNKLMYALFAIGDDTANIPDWKANREKYDAEIVALGERIMKYCPDADIKYEATDRLAFHHCEMGRKQQGRAIYESFPPMIYCREWSLKWALSEDEELSHWRRFILQSYYALSDGLWQLEDLVSDEDAVTVCEKLRALDHIIFDNDPPSDSWSSAGRYFDYAKRLVKVNRIEEAIENLNICIKHVYQFENRPEEVKTTSLLIGERIKKRTDFETTDSRPLHEIIRDKWLAEKEFDAIRDTEEFKAILEQLK